jgi:NCS1 family nucleobase:cation symporter-1
MAGPSTTAASPPRNEQLRNHVESRHIDHIPASARHGRPWQQFAFWFGSNVNVFNLVLGGAVVSFGLSLWWSLIAIAVGVGIGALLIGLHATQGPRLGVPQMIQSRGQFGFYGAAFLFPCVVFLNVVFIAAQLIIQAQSLFAITTALTVPEWILILTVPSVIIGIFGYRWIHYVMQGTAVLVGISLIIMLIQGLSDKAGLPASATSTTHPSLGLFCAAVALLVIDMLSFGPFVSDYSRYLPEDTSGRRLFWAIYGGNVLATIIACGIGAFLASLLPTVVASGSVVNAVSKVSGTWALVVLALSLVGANTFNAYTGAFQVLSFGNMFGRVKAESILARVVPYLVVMAIGVILALLGYRTFVPTLVSFLDVLLVIFIPWSAVNLADYFIVRHGNFDVSSFFTATGAYGGLAWRGLLAYAVGLGAEAPFVSQPPRYVGVLVRHLGGADISWIVGWIVAAGLYLILARVGGNRPAEAGPESAAAA